MVSQYRFNFVFLPVNLRDPLGNLTALPPEPVGPCLPGTKTFIEWLDIGQQTMVVRRDTVGFIS